MSSSAKRPSAAPASSAPPAVVKITLGVIAAIILVMVAAAQVGGSSGAAAGPAPADVLPAEFPVPADAQVVSQGGVEPGAGVITLSVPATAEALVAFFQEGLAQAGWTTEPWEGTDPYGDATRGLILSRDDEQGALSITEGDDGRSTVQVNLNQPVTPTEGGAGMHHGS